MERNGTEWNGVERNVTCGSSSTRIASAPTRAPLASAFRDEEEGRVSAREEEEEEWCAWEGAKQQVTLPYITWEDAWEDAAQQGGGGARRRVVVTCAIARRAHAHDGGSFRLPTAVAVREECFAPRECSRACACAADAFPRAVARARPHATLAAVCVCRRDSNSYGRLTNRFTAFDSGLWPV